MSVVKVTYKDIQPIDYSKLEVPVFIKWGTGLYQLIMNTRGKVVMLSDTGYIQTYGEWDSIGDFFIENPDHQVVDVEIIVTRK